MYTHWERALGERLVFDPHLHARLFVRLSTRFGPIYARTRVRELIHVGRGTP